MDEHARYLVFSIYFLLTIQLIWAAASSCELIENGVEVQTPLGRVKGSLMESREGKTIYAFRGLYYAEPPVEALRFEPPVPVQPWADTFDATKEGSSCPQSKGLNMTENCLTLNIYTQQLNSKCEKLPVIVYIHEGSLYKLSGQSYLHGPQYLLDHNILLVVINYRLGSLGFINTGDYHATGNLGFKDQVMALRYVRDNIEAYGGDPNSVTLAGQSSGGRSIMGHMMSPMSTGLFHRAIALSGSLFTLIPPQREQINLAKKQAKLLNCPTGNLDLMFECMLGVPAKDFGGSCDSMADWRGYPGFIWYPAVETVVPGVERFLTDDPTRLIKKNQKIVNDVPLIVGVTRDEMSYTLIRHIDKANSGNDQYFQELNDNWETLAPICYDYERGTYRSKKISTALRKFYLNDNDVSVEYANELGQLASDSHVIFPVHRAVTLFGKYMKSPVYYYEFAYQSPYGHAFHKGTNKPVGVVHGDDLGYIFPIEDPYYRPNNFPFFKDGDVGASMVKRLTTIWAHFAKTGETWPQDNKLFENVVWERYTPENKNYLLIAKNMSMQTNLNHRRMEFWDKLFPVS